MQRFLATHSSKLIALGLVAAMGGWLLSGLDQGKPVAQAAKPVEQRTAPPSVRVRDFKAQPVTRPIIISGRTEAARAVNLRAELSGRIVGLEVKQGARVEAGDVIARLDLRDREAQLEEARSTLRQRELEYQAGLKLLKRNHISETKLAESKANLETARARVKRIEVEIGNTVIRAPFAGVVDQRSVEIGDYVSTGDTVARLLELDPLLVTGEVAQRDVQHMRLGTSGTAELATGQRVAGRLRYITSEADEATRTFRVELEVSNPNNALMAGVTSEIRIPTQEIAAHYLSPALLSLNAAGQLGVKTVDAAGTVIFHPVALIRAGADGVWVGGLPEQARIITVGQGFVRHGQQVTPVPEQAIAEANNPVSGDPS